MSKRTYQISVQRDEGFMLNIVDEGPRRFLWPLIDAFDWVTRSRFFYTDWVQGAMNWISADEKVVARIPVSYETVQKISDLDWSWSAHAEGAPNE